jgi:feruloyl-CoA synthase
VSELVIAGEGQASIGLLAWVNRAAVERDFGIDAAASLQDAGAAPLRVALAERLNAHNAAHPGASTRVRRCLLLAEPPSVGAHELSDKGTVNRSAVLTRRAAEVERLYAEPAAAGVVALP